MAPKFAVKFLKPCSLQEAECVLLKVIVLEYHERRFCAVEHEHSHFVTRSWHHVHSAVWLQLIDGRHYLVRVSVHSKRADLSVFRRTLVSFPCAVHGVRQPRLAFSCLWHLSLNCPCTDVLESELD